MRALALLTVFVLALSAPASAKIGTGTPRTWLGFQMVYGPSLLGAQRCEDMGEQAKCIGLLAQALNETEQWNICLDKVLFAHNINMMWPIGKKDFRYLTQLDFRAMMIEDLIAQGSYMNELMNTCLPDKNVVLP